MSDPVSEKGFKGMLDRTIEKSFLNRMVDKDATLKLRKAARGVAVVLGQDVGFLSEEFDAEVLARCDEYRLLVKLQDENDRLRRRITELLRDLENIEEDLEKEAPLPEPIDFGPSSYSPECDPGSTISCDHPDQVDAPEHRLICGGCQSNLSHAKKLPVFYCGGGLNSECPVCGFRIAVNNGCIVVPT